MHPFPQPCFGELLDRILVAILIGRQVYGAVGTPTDLLFDGILVDDVMGVTIWVVFGVL